MNIFKKNFKIYTFLLGIIVGTIVFNVISADFSFEDIKNGKKVIPKYHALYLNSLSSVEKNEEFKKYIEEIKNIEPVIPSEVSDILRGYQKDGMAWLSQLSYLGFGGILADDMGLGKTLQVIAYIHGIKPEKPTLIVAPSALTYNWLSEINKFTPNAKTIIVDGAKEDREKLIQTIGEYEFVITSYRF